jgi:hypothetical protein
LKGTSHSFPQSAHVALCISFGYDILFFTSCFITLQIALQAFFNEELAQKPIRSGKKIEWSGEKKNRF